MMQEAHCGFKSNAPAEVRWSPRAFVERVAPYETYDPRVLSLVLIGTAVALMIGAAVMVIIVNRGDDLSEGYDPFNPATKVALVIAAVGVALLFLQGHLLKLLALRRFAARPNRLFHPTWGSILVEIEPSDTYKEVKLSPDDMGLLEIYDDHIFLEMTRHRASFPIDDLVVRFSTVGLFNGLTVSYENEGQSWSVTLTPVVQSWNVLLPIIPQGQCRWLLRRIEAMSHRRFDRIIHG